MASEYAFLSRWRVRGTTREVTEALADATQFPRWWPSVYLGVKELSPGEPETGIGRVIELYTKGWLPYTLRWKFTITESDPPNGFKLVAEGDFVGTGVWTFKQDGDFVDVVYDWRIRADKPLLRLGTPVFRPIFAANHRWAMARGEESLDLELRRRRATTDAFAANHRWAMARGEESLDLELRRRRATTDAARQAIPRPPGPTFHRR